MLEEIAPVLVEVAKTAPFVGRYVSARGKTGRVFWHGRDRYSHAGRYGDDATQHLRECGGRYGYRIGIQSDAGDKFFCRASDAIVCVEN